MNANLEMPAANHSDAVYSRYIDARGDEVVVAPAIVQNLSALLAPAVDDAGLPSVQVLHQGEAFPLHWPNEVTVFWQLHQEDGDSIQGQWAPTSPSWTLPETTPPGYHQLQLSDGTKTQTITLIVTPRRCYQNPLLAWHRLWGSCIQLYTLRSAHNWGIGDFADLEDWIERTAAQGAAFVGLNPIHALYPAMPEQASPYSPSSRRWLNIIYISVPVLDDFQQSHWAQRWFHAPITQQRLQQLRAADWVDYSQVMQLKLIGLHLAFRQFCRRPHTCTDQQQFDRFIAQGGRSLWLQATFDALHRTLNKTGAPTPGWSQWPESYQHPDHPAVKDFQHRHHRLIRFYCWLQWLAQTQFDRCSRLTQSCQMPLGLYRDVAVGVTDHGSQTWSERQHFALNAYVGAPPDILGPLGQNWMLPPIDPEKLKQAHYQPFIEMLRANMQGCGALRLDHVMGLLRLWWIPKQAGARNGAYVRYPIDALLSILALESHRHHCMVIGEDLGTVPQEIVDKLKRYGVLSYKVLYFEKDKQHRFHAPEDYPHQSIATITTHDLPTLSGFFQHLDLQRGEQLGLYPNPVVLAGLHEERRQDCRELVQAIAQTQTFDADDASQFNRAAHLFLSESQSALLGLQPEDWLEMTQPVNIPGTETEYPNWRRKLTLETTQIFNLPRVQELLAALRQDRSLKP
ncbi:4-alpha-glucanotransferase [Celerinatantimonas sp. YJH-8]|uniref:4-alpha-glucanotransferase n=1 Tax=Celerinatantimonas sp. YJH-8 TaxID=3228714 RepID=UPI0038BF04C4